MNILLFGAPGAGKGTQSALLVEQEGMKHISTGNLFRQAIKERTALGLTAQSYIERGDLVPDEIVVKMVREVIGGLGNQPFVLDGFPRTVAQAEALNSQLTEYGLNIGKAVFLDVPRSSLMARLMGRRLCRDCGVNYHVESLPPKNEGVCDHCGGLVIQRADDCEESVSKRLEVYEESTRPLRGYFKQEAKLVNLDGTGSAEDVFRRIQKELRGEKGTDCHP